MNQAIISGWGKTQVAIAEVEGDFAT